MWPTSEPNHEAWNQGVSVWQTQAQAVALAQSLAKRPGGSPFHFIARLDFGLYTPVECDDSLGPPGHWTLYGPVADMLAVVTSSSTQV